MSLYSELETIRYLVGLKEVRCSCAFFHRIRHEKSTQWKRNGKMFLRKHRHSFPGVSPQSNQNNIALKNGIVCKRTNIYGIENGQTLNLQDTHTKVYQCPLFIREVVGKTLLLLTCYENSDSRVSPFLGWNLPQRASKVATIIAGPREILDPVLWRELKGCVVWVDFEIRRHQAERVFQRAAAARSSFSIANVREVVLSFGGRSFFNLYIFTDNFNLYSQLVYAWRKKDHRHLSFIKEEKNLELFLSRALNLRAVSCLHNFKINPKDKDMAEVCKFSRISIEVRWRKNFVRLWSPIQ